MKSSLTSMIARKKGASVLRQFFLFGCLMAIVLASAVRTRAADNTVYANTFSSPYTVYTVNTTTGALTAAGNFSFSSIAMARRSSDGLVFYTEYGVTNGRVATWNPNTNVNTVIGTLGTGVRNYPRLAFNAAGVLYGIDDTARLYTVNTTTGAATLVGTIAGLPSDIRGDIAFAPDGTLYALAGTTSRLYTINIGTLTATPIGLTGTTNLAGLAFARAGLLFAIESDSPNNVQTLNLATGTATIISAQTTALYDMASMPKFADLSISKTSGSTFIIGSNASYSISVTNNGPHSASGPITVTDTLPAGLTYVSASGTGWTCSFASGTVTCTTAGPVGNGVTLPTITLTVTVGAAAAPSVTNTARVASTTFDHESTNDSGSVTKTVSAPAPNVSLVKSVSPSGSQTPGADLAYTIAFTNGGSATAQSLVIGDPIPNNTDFKVGSVTTSLGTTGLTVVIAYSNNGGSTYVYTPVSGGGGAPAGYDRNVTNIRWTFSGNLSQTAPNNSGSVGFTARIR